MFSEIATQRTHSQGYRRRWFQSASMDLYTWHVESGVIAGFQLAYDRLSNQRAITWVRDRGFFHARIDEGDPGFVAQTPVLVADGPFDAFRVHADFVAQAVQIDPDIAQFVARKLRAYLGRERPPARFVTPWILGAVILGCAAGMLLQRFLTAER